LTLAAQEATCQEGICKACNTEISGNPMTAIIDLATHPLTRWTGFEGLPDFAVLTDEQFKPVFDAALAAHAAEIEAIAGNPDAPTLENTLAALELCGDALGRVSSIFWLRAGAHTNDLIQELEREIAPAMSRHYSAISMNPKLFARIDALYRDREKLAKDTETLRVIEKSWKGFVRSGAKLGTEDQKRFAAINERLSVLGASFGQNVLADEKIPALILADGDDLAGLPDWLKAAMASAAAERGHEGKFAVTLSRSIIEPFLTFSTRRDLREAAFNAWVKRGEMQDAHDNRPVVKEMLALRAEKAKLLGYPSFAAFKLDNTMAKTPEAVNDLLGNVWGRAVKRAIEEEEALASLAAREGANHAIKPWDWRHFAEKLKAQRFAFNEDEVKPHLEINRIIAACFDVASRLFGLKFEEHKGVAAWHPDVRVFSVLDGGGKRIGLFLGDYFARSTKRSGAWMSALQDQHRLGDGSTPIIYNVMNFAKAPDGQPTFLSFDDARTLFHEFGHALHGLLSDVTWPSVSGTSVSRDFVELPSQLYEHWLTVPEVLEKHALHHETGKPMDKALIAKIKSARNFNSGFQTVEFVSSALVDMDAHKGGAVDDPMGQEAALLEKLAMPSSIVMRHRTPHFAHVYSGDGYSAGYYSYMWSEVLDADAFNAFEETGDAFDPATAARLKTHVYAAGGSVDPEDTYKAFRGRMPTPDAMLAKRGLG
jgi:peptidyl-dipeptidase Dcp